MILVHQDFQGRHYYHHFGGDPDAREKHRDELTPSEFALAEQFADEWDQIAFDPDYDTLPLEHFEAAVREGLRHAKLPLNARRCSRLRVVAASGPRRRGLGVVEQLLERRPAAARSVARTARRDVASALARRGRVDRLADDDDEPCRLG